MYDGNDHQLLLAERPPTRLQRSLAYGVVAGLLAALCLTAPYANIQLPILAAFIPIQVSVIVVNDLITAALLLAQFWVVRWTWLLVLACGFLFSAAMFVPFALTFPGVFSPSGLLGAGLQTAAWFSVCLHLGAPAAVIVAALIRGTHHTDGPCQRSPGHAIVLSIAMIFLIVCGLTWAILTYSAVLPPIFQNTVQQIQGIPPSSLLIFAFDAIALTLMWRKGRSVLDLWLTVICFTWLFEISLGALFPTSRFSLGWYTARIFQMAATYFVLIFLLSEATALYANTVKVTIRRRGARQARQVAMDTMAASIAHEIRQPLTALIANAEASAIRLRKPEPNIVALTAAVDDIAAASLRIREIIGEARVLFKNSAHERKPLDVNEVVRDVLKVLDLDMRLQRVTVKTELANDLGTVFADSGQLHQVFLNLVNNALEAMNTVNGRPPVLTIRSSLAPTRTYIVVTVEDTGVGITSKDSDRIFEPFYSTKATGSGVGLSICKMIIDAHGGMLQVRANTPYGTIFRVELVREEYE